MKKGLLLMLSVVLCSALATCAPGSSIQVNTSDSTFQLSMPGPNPSIYQPDAQGRVAGIVAGLWHGVILPITLLFSLFNPNVQVYEVHNAGFEYNFGFILGELLIFALIALFIRIRRSAQ